MPVPSDFQELLPPKVAKDKRPFMYLFSFDPEENKVYLEERGLGRKDGEFAMHHRMAEHVHHEDRVDGYALAIKDGWRIVDDSWSDVDPYVRKKVLDALGGKHPAPPLPTIPYHGDPRQTQAQ